MENLVDTYTPEQQNVIAAATDLARTLGYDASHTSHVTRLSTRLFDELQPLHGLDNVARCYLTCAGILHDIGWVEGWRRHHKATLNIILNTSLLPLENRERLIIGSVARYHTKALPNPRHDHFAALELADQRVVLVLAALLRLADGLDWSHRWAVRDVKCKIAEHKITVYYGAPVRSKREEKGAKEKSDLLALVFDRKVTIKWEPI